MPPACAASQPGDDLQNRVDRFGWRERALLAHAILQRAARQQLHRDDGRAGDFFAAEDVDAVGMVDRRRKLALTKEARPIVADRPAADSTP